MKQDVGHSHTGSPSAHGFVEVTNERFEQRRQCNFPATVQSGDGGQSGHCQVLDMSASGARLSLAGSSFGQKRLSDSFWLRFPHDGSQVRCKVVWEEGKTFGVRFTSPMQTTPRRRKAVAKPSSKKRSLFGLIGM